MEYDNVKNLGLKPNEMNSLTKLSLSKIVSNHKQQLEEEVLVVEGLRDSEEGLRNRLSEVGCLLATEQKNNEYGFSFYSIL